MNDMRKRVGVSPETMDELRRVAAELRDAQGYVRAHPRLLPLLDDDTALGVLESMPADGGQPS